MRVRERAVVGSQYMEIAMLIATVEIQAVSGFKRVRFPFRLQVAEHTLDNIASIEAGISIRHFVGGRCPSATSRSIVGSVVFYP